MFVQIFCESGNRNAPKRVAGKLAAGLALILLSCVGGTTAVRAAGVQDSPELEYYPKLDLDDLYVFPGSDESRVCLALTLNGILAPGDRSGGKFDPTVLYQIKIDNTGDGIEDLVIQFRFEDLPGKKQNVEVYGPLKPELVGNVNYLEKQTPALEGETNQVLIRKVAGYKAQIFAGLRDQPLYFDYEQACRIHPDRRPSLGDLAQLGPVASASAFRAKAENGVFLPGQDQFVQTMGAATDYFAGLNCLAIIVEIPDVFIHGATGNIGVWATVSRKGERRSNFKRQTYEQMDRVGNPFVADMCIQKREHAHYNLATPAEDPTEFRDDIAFFVANVAHRSTDYANQLAALWTPDTLPVQLDKVGGGPYGSNVGWLKIVLDSQSFGGRKLKDDDSVDTLLDAVFGDYLGNTANNTPGLVKDNVDENDHPPLTTFPYMAPPN